MKSRGRVAAAAIAVSPPAPIETVARQRAPHDLTDEESEVWACVVNNEPGRLVHAGRRVALRAPGGRGRQPTGSAQTSGRGLGRELGRAGAFGRVSPRSRAQSTNASSVCRRWRP
jgi:hypothetical protein